MLTKSVEKKYCKGLISTCLFLPSFKNLQIYNELYNTTENVKPRIKTLYV